jgi:hypothetical protein
VIGAAFAVLARQRDRPYLMGQMVQPHSTQAEILSGSRPARRLAQVIVVAGAGLGAAMLAGALVLWFHYGTAVFFEMIASGIAACF